MTITFFIEILLNTLLTFSKNTLEAINMDVLVSLTYSMSVSPLAVKSIMFATAPILFNAYKQIMFSGVFGIAIVTISPFLFHTLESY